MAKSNEREKVIAEMHHHVEHDGCACCRTKDWADRLTREQREGECPACGLAWGEHRLGYAASSCKVKPQQEAPGAVAMWRAMTASGKWMYFDHEPTHMPNYQRLYTTPQPGDGWVLVPIDPTPEMWEAADNALNPGNSVPCMGGILYRDPPLLRWHAMLAAAPSAKGVAE